MNWHWRYFLRKCLIACAFLQLATGAIDERTLECEQAIAHLGDCCSSLRVPNACGDGCSQVTLRLEESHCIQDRSCAELVAAGVCRRVEDVSLREADYSEEATWEPVCP